MGKYSNKIILSFKYNVEYLHIFKSCYFGVKNIILIFFFVFLHFF